jgi:hypothetical protein
MELFTGTVNAFFQKELSVLKCDPVVRAYIVGVLSDFKTAKIDYSQESITTVYSEASLNNSFLKFQSVADWLFLCSSLYPEHLNGASIDYYYAVGQVSYYRCYKLLNKKLKVYEALSDCFISLANDVGNIIK